MKNTNKIKSDLFLSVDVINVDSNAASCDRHGRTAPGLISKPLQLAISFVLIARFKSLLQEALIPTHWQQLSSITVHWQSILKDEQPTTKVEQSISKVQQSVSNERPLSYGHHWLAISPKGNIDVTVSLYLTKAIVLFNANRHEDAMMHMDQLSADLFVNPLTCGVVVASLQLQLGTIVFKIAGGIRGKTRDMEGVLEAHREVLEAYGRRMGLGIHMGKPMGVPTSTRTRTHHGYGYIPIAGVPMGMQALTTPPVPSWSPSIAPMQSQQLPVLSTHVQHTSAKAGVAQTYVEDIRKCQKSGRSGRWDGMGRTRLIKQGEQD
ncbi:hypothetical protein F4604DRAFT_1687742 [Suillus subluteus]|nr:hypothetical protein F4604DRAFT_1687742 [Suillus subluteus]